jgi:excisionase family DNA binding protein
VTTGVGEDDTGLLKVPQVAKRLGVSEVTVWRLIRKGKTGDGDGLESIQVGRSRRVSPDVVEAYKRRHATAQDKAA